MKYSYTGDAHHRLRESYQKDEKPFPTETSLSFPERVTGFEEFDLLKQLFFPRCWNAGSLTQDTEAVREMLSELGSLFCLGIRPYTGENCTEQVDEVLDRLPAIRHTLQKDVEAAYKGDPAAKSYIEVIRSYPGFQAIMGQRVAHALYNEGISAYARELTEYAKSETGIDIHPGAEISDYFFIDHGTGVVIGETTTIGDWVRIYQDVTLGALHFEKEENEQHMLKKGYKRHPDIGDHVVIGAGTKILGTISIGDHVSIGANSWITEDIPDHTSVYIADHPEQERKRTE
ncbi:serine O-acetyltransferase EpsC [Halopenitus sp. H-Gu1]|uniref:serine O-acetyltransferase EpsC n=1 Tax=Halopenitus sp. H-Gu1 TaxID=3242697 RepID=UPI00359CD742